MKWADCKNACQKQCNNMHIFDTAACQDLECEPGCECEEGLVYSDGQCIVPSSCPCFHAGQSYKTGETINTECEDCVCNAGGTFSCVDKPCWGTCSVFGDPHFTSFDNKRFDFQGTCSYIFARSTTSWIGNSFLVTVKSVPCGSSGVTCTRDIELNYNGTTVSIDRHSNLESLTMHADCVSWESGLFSFIRCGDDLTLKWDRGTRLALSLNPKFKTNVEGLCGNYNDDQSDDFKTPSNGPSEQVATVFGDSWKLYGYCPKANGIINTCELHPHRHQWAQKTCAIIRSDLFEACHHEVMPKYFHDSCIFDACGCDSGGDCECACTAIAAYAAECARHNVIVDWRSETLCPVQCGDCPSKYSSCLDPCPKTCQNRHDFEKLTSECHAGACVEGCACGNGTIWDENFNECVDEKECSCGVMNGKIYKEGEAIPEISDECQKCFCVSGEFSCIGSPCTSSEAMTTTPSPVFTTTGINIVTTTAGTTVTGSTTTGTTTAGSTMITTKATDGTTTESIFTTSSSEPITTTTGIKVTTTPSPTTTFTTASNDAKCIEDKDYWTNWMNYNFPSSKTLGDFENSDLLRRGYVFCPDEMIGAVQCRAVGNPAGDQNIECNLENGLVCLHSQQNDAELCHDYEVRFYCRCAPETTTPTAIVSTTAKTTTIKVTSAVTNVTEEVCQELPPSCQKSGYTEWFPSTMENPRCYSSYCADPIAMECKGPDGTKPKTCDIKNGFTCEGDYCDEYLIRYHCECETSTTAPTKPPTDSQKECSDGWTEWFNINKPTDSQEIETIASVLSTYPTCNPIGLECRNEVTGIIMTDDETNDFSAQLETCMLGRGYNCVGKNCYDYSIRVNCKCNTVTTISVTAETTTIETTTDGVTTTTPGATTGVITKTPQPHVCAQSGWSNWFSTNKPTEDGETESLKSIYEQYGFNNDMIVVDMNCRTLDSHINTKQLPYPSTCDSNFGYKCISQGDFKCEDVEIRIYCKIHSPPTLSTTTTKPSTTTTQSTTAMHTVPQCSDMDSMNIKTFSDTTMDGFEDFALTGPGWRGETSFMRNAMDVQRVPTVTLSSNDAPINIKQLIFIENDFGEFPREVTVKTKSSVETFIGLVTAALDKIIFNLQRYNQLKLNLYPHTLIWPLKSTLMLLLLK